QGPPAEPEARSEGDAGRGRGGVALASGSAGPTRRCSPGQSDERSSISLSVRSAMRTRRLASRLGFQTFGLGREGGRVEPVNHLFVNGLLDRFGERGR